MTKQISLSEIEKEFKEEILHGYNYKEVENGEFSKIVDFFKRKFIELTDTVIGEDETLTEDDSWDQNRRNILREEQRARRDEIINGK